MQGSRFQFNNMRNSNMFSEMLSTKQVNMIGKILIYYLQKNK